VLQAVHFRQPENTLISSCRAYWSDLRSTKKQQDSHWRGVGIFADDARWLALGDEHFEIYEEFSRAVNFRRPRRIVEWGCGGGINAVRFGPLADVFYGIDISPDSLKECARQTQNAGLHNFTPVLIDPANPEAVLTHIESCDLVISTYVFEALPSPEYGVRVLRVIREVLSPGGMAVIQTKYKEGSKATASRRWNYAKNLAWNATYRIEEFWELAGSCGLTPKMVKLQPEQPLVFDRNYAYFCLIKMAGS
jgi:SAM-dependent methyltransferase